MVDAILDLPMESVIPAGVIAPVEVVMSVRAFLTPHPNGMTLIDTGIDPMGHALDAALAHADVFWDDVTDVVITHGHADHVGGLAHVMKSAPSARVHAHPAEGVEGALPFVDGDVVNGLRALSTPGHTKGHLSLIEEYQGVLFAGDCVGIVDGRMVRAPEQFTADSAAAERSLRLLHAVRADRMLFAHGPEVANPWQALSALLEG
jgi:glyoxylase-like metal-dependent hydrolase (beta-lactamase superfamily II)